MRKELITLTEVDHEGKNNKDDDWSENHFHYQLSLTERLSDTTDRDIVVVKLLLRLYE